jgi:nucleotide-binding universal stress UspA family protein
MPLPLRPSAGSTPDVGIERGPASESGAIVVGVDGSEASERALRWAIEEARLRDTRVLAVQAWLCPALGIGHRRGAIPGYEELRQDAGEILDAAVNAVGDVAHGVTVERRLVEGIPAEVLIAAADGAAMLVLGSRGLGGFAGLLLGSVGQQCAHHARCPVVIVPHGERGTEATAGGRQP